MNGKPSLLTGVLLCKLLIINQAYAQATEPCIDTDGDGYGWNGTETCRPSNVEISRLTNIKNASVSKDGRFVVHETTITDYYNKTILPDKVWLHDRDTNTTTPLHTDASGSELLTLNGVMSRDGRFVAYSGAPSEASPEAQGIYIYDINNNKTTELVAPYTNGNALKLRQLKISDDGSYIAYHTIGFPEIDTIHIVNRLTGDSVLASVDESGYPLDAILSQGIAMQAMSGDGRYLFTSKFVRSYTESGALVSTDYIYSFNVETGATTRILDFTDNVMNLTSSTDGKTIAFSSEDNTLVPNDTSGVYSSFLGYNYSRDDAFVYELETSKLTRVSVDSSGNEAADDGPSLNPQISADGRYVSFESYTNLDTSAGDCDYIYCEYIHDRDTGKTTRLNDLSGLAISENGTLVQYSATSQDVYSFVMPSTSMQCIDSNGDGYGWNGVETCIPDPIPPVINPNCDYSSANQFGGWGWNAIEQKSCKPLIVVPPTPTQCVDTDGDGYGWNGIETCDPLAN